MSGVRYWRLPSEEETFLEYLEKQEPVVAMPIRSYRSERDVKWLPLRKAIAEAPPTMIITPKRFEGALAVTDEFVDGGWAPSVPTTPALYYAPGKARRRALRMTVVSASWDWYDVGRQERVPHPADYVRWARRVIQWVRRQSPHWRHDKNLRLTPAALEASKKGLELLE